MYYIVYIYISVWCCMISVLELSSLHTRHLNRPTLDDSIDEEHVIEDHTARVTRVCQVFNYLFGRLFQQSKIQINNNISLF